MENYVLYSPYTDIYRNLALEQMLARDLTPEIRILLLWISSPAVVFGRFQNPWAECPTAYLEAQGIALARRSSGGGAVYHDPGNLNYTVIAPRGAFNSEGNLTAVAHALNLAGLAVHTGPRRDLWVQGYKVSGSAFQLHRNFSIHHGTLLISADLNRLRQVLESRLLINGSRAVSSVPSPVTNIGPLTGRSNPETWIEPIRTAFENHWGATLTFWQHPLPDTTEYQMELTSWEWVYGQTPGFLLRPASQCPFTLWVEEGRVTALADAAGKVTEPTAEAIPLTTAGLCRLIKIYPTLTPYVSELHRELAASGTKEANHALRSF